MTGNDEAGEAEKARECGQNDNGGNRCCECVRCGWLSLDGAATDNFYRKLF